METNRIYTYEQEKIYRSSSDTKFWSLTPKPGETLEGSRITRDSLMYLAHLSFIGVGHVPDVARARMDEMVRSPRESTEGYFYEDAFSFIMPVHKQDPLTVLAFSPESRGVGDKWLIEIFRDGAIEPEVEHLQMMYPPRGDGMGAHQVDQVSLVNFLEDRFPTNR